MAHRALYLRYRPKTFAEVKGQQHVIRAIQSAVREGRVGHAYLLHGPRGTGKTTIARLMAKALNCEALSAEGEPCGKCESCASVEENRSFDLHELDAASNNKVDDMRTLLERVNLTTPGRAKVYLLDEVHMLTTGAENALLKTLEEPPGHVTWVMATTEPHKVAETIRSRCQVFELGLLNADLMADHVRHVADDADLDIGDDVVDQVVSAGAGSVRDTLSALDSVVPGAKLETASLDSATDVILAAVTSRDPAAALTAVDDAVGRGRAPRTIGESALTGLRNAFIAKMGITPPRLSEQDRIRAEEISAELTAAALTRSMEILGRALINMRQAPDPRVDVEVALVRLCTLGTESENELDELRQRVERLEGRIRRIESQKGSRRAPQRPAGMPAAPSVPPIPPTPSTRSAPPIPPTPSTRSAPPIPPTPSTRSAPQAPNIPRSRPVRSGLMQLSPRTPTEVVGLAAQHLGMSREAVVSHAKSTLPPKQSGQRHDPEDLSRLWRSLVAASTGAPDDEPSRHGTTGGQSADTLDERTAEEPLLIPAPGNPPTRNPRAKNPPMPNPPTRNPRAKNPPMPNPPTRNPRAKNPPMPSPEAGSPTT